MRARRMSQGRDQAMAERHSDAEGGLVVQGVLWSSLFSLPCYRSLLTFLLPGGVTHVDTSALAARLVGVFLLLTGLALFCACLLPLVLGTAALALDLHHWPRHDQHVHIASKHTAIDFLA